VSGADTTRWTVIRDAAGGDAAQEVFVDLFRDGGALDRVEPGRPGGFRAFFLGVVRNVARHVETCRGRSKERQPPNAFDPGDRAGDEESLAAAFDRAWAMALLRRAVDLHRERARGRGEAARRRVELLRLRFREGLPIRDIARRWEMEPRRLHKDYARARDEFRDVLLDVVAEHHGGSRAEAGCECSRLLELVR
jgi:RNA polymerase sigma-70 factor (ECF subfamily)